MKHRKYYLIIGAFLVAVLFWLFVVLNNTFITTMSVPLRIVNLPVDVAISNPLPENVEVSFSGSGWQLIILTLKRNLFFDLPGQRIHSDRIVYPNRYLSEALKLPANVVAVRVFPEALEIDVDLFLRKIVPVRVVLDSLTFKEDFGLSGPIMVEPDSITLMGAEKVIRRISSWPTVRRGYQQLSMSVADEVLPADSLPGIVRFTRDPLKLVIPVEQMADMPFRNIKITIRGAPVERQVLLEKSAIDVYVRGGVSLLSQLTADEFSASVDYQSILDDTTGTVTPAVRIPSGLLFLKTEPSRIKYTIRQ